MQDFIATIQLLIQFYEGTHTLRIEWEQVEGSYWQEGLVCPCILDDWLPRVQPALIDIPRVVWVRENAKGDGTK